MVLCFYVLQMAQYFVLQLINAYDINVIDKNK